ncbi:hypothetical protein Tco_1439552 [Tanacetum coccineum]
MWNNSSRVNHKNFANKMTHPYPNRRFVPQVVFTRSGKINTAGASVNIAGNPQQKEYNEKGVIDSGFSRHMTRNKCYLTEYEDYDGGFVSFRDGKGRISRKDSPFNLEAFSDSNYAGASLDRKSITGGCQFLGQRLISWQCKKQTIVANSTTEAEYVAIANCCRQVFKDGFDGRIGLKMLFGPVLRVKHGKKLVSASRLALCCWEKVSTVRHRVSAARQT